MKSTITLVAVAMFAMLSLSSCGDDEAYCGTDASNPGSPVPIPCSSESSHVSASARVSPTTTQTTTTTVQPTTQVTQTPSTVYLPLPTTTTPSAITVYTVAPTTMTTSVAAPSPIEPAWHVSETVANCESPQQVNLGSQRLFSTTVTLNNAYNGMTMLSFDRRPDFEFKRVFLTSDPIQSYGGFPGYPVVGRYSGSNLSSDHVFGNGNAGDFVIQTTGVMHAILCN